MIKTIRAINIKGNTFDQGLTGKDIFVGPNGSGKSTRLQAVQLAMLGYIPGKKTNSETFKLSSGEEMTAGLQLDDFSFDRSIIRTEKLKGTGVKDIKYSESITVSPSKGELNTTQMNARITAETGNFPMVFDFQQFLDMSDAKRREFIYGLSPISSEVWDKPKVSSHLTEKLLTQGLKETNPDLFEASQELINDCLSEWPSGYDLSSGLQSMMSWIETQQKHWNKKQNDATGAVRELAEMKNKLEETDRDIISKKDELKVFRQQHTDVHGQIKAGHEIKRQWDQKRERLSELKIEIERLTGALSTRSVRDYESEIETLQQSIKQTDVSSEAKAIQEQIDALVIKRELKATEEHEAKVKADKLSLELTTMEMVLKNIKEKGAGVCVIHHQIGCDKDFSKFTSFVGERGPTLQEQINSLGQQQLEISTEIKGFREKESSLEKSKQALYESADKESESNDLIRKQIESIRKEEREESSHRQETQNKIINLQQEQERLLNDKQPTFAPLEILEPQLVALAKQIEELEQIIEEKEKAKITLSNSQTAMISASKAQYYHTASKTLAEALGAKGIQGELVKGVLSPVEDSINENLSLMGIRFPMFFSTESETGKEIFQFGWIKNDRKTNFDVLSTGEKLMFLSAFLVTLLERANPPLKVLAIDDINNLDKKNLQGVLNGLNALSHKIDNILIAGVVDLVEADGWKVWNLSPEVAGVAQRV
ncbi:Chromosome partition protein Smc [compost metagenome]